MQAERIPDATVGGSYAYGWQQLKEYFLSLFLIGVVLTLVNVPAGGLDFPLEDAGAVLLQLLAAAYAVLILPVFEYGGDLLYLKHMRNERAEVGDIAQGFKRGYLDIILANLLVFAIVAIGFILLIVPGVILAIRLSFVPYIVMDKRLDAIAAVEKSWHMTRGRSWPIFGMFLLAIPLLLGGLLLLFVGAFFAYLWIKAAFASFYYAADLEDEEQLDRNGVDPAPRDSLADGG